MVLLEELVDSSLHERLIEVVPLVDELKKATLVSFWEITRHQGQKVNAHDNEDGEQASHLPTREWALATEVDDKINITSFGANIVRGKQHKGNEYILHIEVHALGFSVVYSEAPVELFPE